jgi:hypothetical protein
MDHPNVTKSCRKPTGIVDKPRGEFFHTNWTGRSGTTTARAYTV